MSTILKSLKKLEQARESKQYTGPVAEYSGPGSMSLHGAKQSWIRSSWFKRSLVAVIILGLGASSLYFYNQSQDIHRQAETDKTPPLTARNTAKRPQQKATLPEGNSVAKVTPRKPPVSIQKPIKKDRPPVTVKRMPITPRNTPSPTVSNNPKPESSTIKRRPAISRTEDATSTEKGVNTSTTAKATQRVFPRVSVPPKNDAKSSTLAQSEVKTAKKKPAKTPAESFQNVSSLTDGRLKVQAIVWSRIPEDRMTVINSRVLHEGDTVEEFTLVVIRPDDVVVKERGGARWKVMFGRP